MARHRDLKRQVRESKLQLQQAVKQRDDEIKAKLETQTRAEQWIRKIQDARAKERSAHTRELMDCDARREAAENKLHLLSSRFQRNGQRNLRWSEDSDDSADTLSVNSVGSAPTHLAGQALEQAAKSVGDSGLGYAVQRGQMASKRRGADQVSRASEGRKGRSGRTPPSVVPPPAAAPAAAHPMAMPDWYSLVEQTRKLHAADKNASSEPAGVGSVSGRRSNSSSSSSEVSSGDRPGLDDQVQQASTVVPATSAKGRWAARAAEARRRRP